MAKKLFPTTEEQILCVREYYKKTQSEIDRDCEIIKEWMSQQAHFPNDYDKNRIERFLLRNKFRIQRTKQKMESYYTIRGNNQMFLKKMDPNNKDMHIVLEEMRIIPLPKLLNQTERIYVFRYNKNAELFSLENSCLLVQALLEFEILYDYTIGVRFIIDFENFSIGHITKMDLNVIVRYTELYQECLSGRFLSMEFINLTPAINYVMTIFKQAFPEKLYNKIRIHKNLESLKTNIPVEYLPKEYGGNLGSMDDIHEDVKQLYMQNRDFLMKRIEMISDETKRVTMLKKNELFGVEGTFRTINLD